MSYRDEWVTCKQCEKQFIFTVEEQRRLTETGLDVVPPKRCQGCRRQEPSTAPQERAVDQRQEISTGPQEGVVKWYDPEKGYGFILQHNGDDIFFHRSGVAGEAPERFPDGARVTYLVEQAQKGPQAVEVALMDE